MMKMKLIIGIIASLLLTQIVIAQAKPTRIIFKRGQSSASVTGIAKGSKEAKFVIKLKKGQTLSLSAEQGSVNVFVDFPNGDGDGAPGGLDTEPLPADGDYIITVKDRTQADSPKGKFVLKVSVK